MRADSVRLVGAALLLVIVPMVVVKTVLAASPTGGASSAAPDGRTLFAVHCSSCHGTSAQGSKIAPPLINAGAAAVDWYLSTGRMPLAYPEEEPARKESAFDRREIDALVAYIDSLSVGSAGARGPSIPTVDVRAGDPVHGRQLFAQNCQSCHGSDGEGNSVGFGWLAPSLYEATPTQVAEAVRFGPGIMPRFGERQLGRHDFDSLVRYVVTLKAPDDRGGFPLGHIGPVTEGLVGWIFGFGILFLGIKLIGTKT
ncbi:MAG: c-type cytochrome [Candidatus Eremiobacteraeota bacterium]|nr:c-type cytochrome [Candidatus Eremiobacteraeota bacterium]MBC5827303.1 c-type cytochrome [Candidatus Eremiobacteraeota bacterium]